MDEIYFEIFSDSGSTGLDDFYPPLLPELFLETDPLQIPPAPSSSISQDKSITYLCDICHKSVIKLENSSYSTRKKRKTSELQLIVASMKVCEKCRNLDIDSLKALQSSASSKIVVKRENAKKRVLETELLKKFKLPKEQTIEETPELDESEKKKMKQVIRNRISAQQSRDRKKAYLSEVEEENKKLKQQNGLLQHKVKELVLENGYLKNQLSGFHLASSSSDKSKLALAAFLLITMIAVLILQDGHQQLQSRVLLSPNGEAHVNETNTQGELISLAASHEIAKFREWRQVQETEAKFLESLEPCHNKFDYGKMTTVYCPKVQALWESQNTGLKHLQLILPLSSLPMMQSTQDSSVQEYLLEVLCTVKDVNIIPNSSG